MERPHFIQSADGGELRPASTAEIAPLIVQHEMHDGIAFFPDCARCVEGKAAGRYPQWSDD